MNFLKILLIILISAGVLSTAFAGSVEREVEITHFDYSVSGSRITFWIDIQNTDYKSHEVTVYLRGEKNFDYPKSFTVDISAGKTENIKKTYYTSDFGKENFVVECYAKTDSGKIGSNSLPAYVFVEPNYYSYNYNYYNNYGFGSVYITKIELDTNIFYPGDIVEGKVFIKNTGSQETQYRFEYVYDNHAYKRSVVGHVLPGETKAEDIVLEIPDSDSFKLTAKVMGKTTSIREKTFLVSQRFKYFSSQLSQETVYVRAGENASVTLALRNLGNEDDFYKIRLEGWELYTMQDTASLKPGEEKKIEISFSVPESAKVKVYPAVLQVTNSENAVQTKAIQLSVTKPEAEQSEVVFEDKIENRYFEENETVVYAIDVKNLELESKTYYAVADAENAEVIIVPESIVLDSGESGSVSVDVTPESKEDTEVMLSLYANGEQIFSNTVQLNYTKNKQRSISGITGFAVFEGKAWIPGVYLLALIGLVSLGYIGYRKMNEKMKTEKLIQSNNTKTSAAKPVSQAVQTQMTPEQIKTQQHINTWPREQRSIYSGNFQNTPAQHPHMPQSKDDYADDSFMKRF